MGPMDLSIGILIGLAVGSLATYTATSRVVAAARQTARDLTRDLASTRATVDALTALHRPTEDTARLMADHTERTVELMGDALMKVTYPPGVTTADQTPAPEPDPFDDDVEEFHDPRLDPDGHDDVATWGWGDGIVESGIAEPDEIL